MAKKPKRSNKTEKPAKAGKAKADGRSGKDAKQGQALPKPRVTAAQSNALVALMQGIDRRLRQIERQQQEERRRREQEQQAATPSPTTPSPHDAAFAAIPESVAELRERVGRLEAAQQQPARDPSLDAPASVAQLRHFFAGACKTLGFVRPTPAIVGRAMHSEKAFEPRAAKSPYVLFNAIYQAVKQALGLPSAQPEASSEDTRDFVHLDAEMVELMEERSVRPQKKHSTYYNRELQPRLQLLENMRLACVEPNKTGERTDYSRYLTPLGRELFNNWPEWTDATGGIGLADEEPSPPASPATTTANERDATASAAGPAPVPPT